MRDAGVINEDMAKVIEMQSKQMQNQMADINPNILAQGLGGVLPGSNPI